MTGVIDLKMAKGGVVMPPKKGGKRPNYRKGGKR